MISTQLLLSISQPAYVAASSSRSLLATLTSMVPPSASSAPRGDGDWVALQVAQTKHGRRTIHFITAQRHRKSYASIGASNLRCAIGLILRSRRLTNVSRLIEPGLGQACRILGLPQVMLQAPRYALIAAGVAVVQVSRHRPRFARSDIAHPCAPVQEH